MYVFHYYNEASDFIHINYNVGFYALSLDWPTFHRFDNESFISNRLSLHGEFLHIYGLNRSHILRFSVLCFAQK